jgi:hypothetical protein
MSPDLPPPSNTDERFDNINIDVDHINNNDVDCNDDINYLNDIGNDGVVIISKMDMKIVTYIGLFSLLPTLTDMATIGYRNIQQTIQLINKYKQHINYCGFLIIISLIFTRYYTKKYFVYH